MQELFYEKCLKRDIIFFRTQGRDVPATEFHENIFGFAILTESDYVEASQIGFNGFGDDDE